MERGGVHHQIQKRNFLIHHLAVGAFDLHFENLAGAKDLGGAAAGDDGFELASGFQAAADIVDEFAEGHATAGDFVETGALDIAADAHGAGAAVAGGSHFGVFLGAHREDVLHMADRLHIVDDRGLHVEAEDGGEVRRLDAGVGAFALEGFEEAGLLAANVGAGPLVDINVQVEARTENVFSKKTFGFRLLDGFPNDLRGLWKFAADVDVGEVDIRREGGDGEAFDQLVRILVQDVAVLESAGLGFVAIDDDVVGLAVVVFDEAPLGTGREARSTASAEVGGLDHIDDLAGLHAERLFEGLVAAVGEVGLDVRRVAGFGNVAEDDAAFLRMRSG